MNNVQISGRLTKDVELGISKEDKKIARWTLAVSRFNKDKGADFIPCVAFDKEAEFISNYFAKGNMMIVTAGKINIEGYLKDDEHRMGFCVIVNEVEFGERKKKDSDSASTNNKDFADDVAEEDLPFK